MSEEKKEPTPEEINRQKARWCYAHASRPVAEVDSLDDGECETLAAVAARVEAGEVRLDTAVMEFLSARRERLEEAKAVDAEDDQSPNSEE